MSHKAIEAVKVKLQSGDEITYEPETDMTRVGTGVLVESAKIHDTVTGEETIIEAGTATVFGGGGVHPPVKVPKVISSVISTANPNRILVEWDEDMKGSADVRFALDLIIDGAAAIVPSTVSFSNKFMTMGLNVPAKKGQVITWSYNDQNPSELLESVAGSVEADNQTYSVANNIA